MVEIFRTDVRQQNIADQVVRQLTLDFPGFMINFDLDDYEKILRVASNASGTIEPECIIRSVRAMGITIEYID